MAKIEKYNSMALPRLVADDFVTDDVRQRLIVTSSSVTASDFYEIPQPYVGLQIYVYKESGEEQLSYIGTFIVDEIKKGTVSNGTFTEGSKRGSAYYITKYHLTYSSTSGTYEDYIIDYTPDYSDTDSGLLSVPALEGMKVLIGNTLCIINTNEGSLLDAIRNGNYIEFLPSPDIILVEGFKYCPKDIIYFCTDTGGEHKGKVYFNGKSYDGVNYTAGTGITFTEDNGNKKISVNSVSNDYINSLDSTTTTDNDKVVLGKDLKDYHAKVKGMLSNIDPSLYDLTYTTTVPNNTNVQYNATVKASDLKDKTFSEVIDTLFFPEDNATLGTLPSWTVNNSNETKEVGTTISNASGTPSAGDQYGYIKSSGAYIKANYGYTNPNIVTTIKNGSNTVTDKKFILGTLTRSTASTASTITGPTNESLASGGFLYKSRGTVSTIKPIDLTEETRIITIAATSKSLKGYYKGTYGKGSTTTYSKVDNLLRDASGDFATSSSGSFTNTYTYKVMDDSSTTADHSPSTAGIVYIGIPLVNGHDVTASITALIYGISAFESSDTSEALNEIRSIIPSISTTTLKDAANTDYYVDIYRYDFSSLKAGDGKFKIYINLTNS